MSTLDSTDPNDYERHTLEVDEECALKILCKRESDEGRVLRKAMHRGRPLGGKYSAQRHQAHTAEGKTHLHVYARNNQLFAINVDGSAHDTSHGIRIPNKVADAIRRKFPEFRVPADNLIKSIEDSVFELWYFTTFEYPFEQE